jgi:hypothetical protein
LMNSQTSPEWKPMTLAITAAATGSAKSHEEPVVRKDRVVRTELREHFTDAP